MGAPGLPIFGSNGSGGGGNVYEFDGPTTVNGDGSISVTGTRTDYVENTGTVITLTTSTQVLVTFTITIATTTQLLLIEAFFECDVAPVSSGGAPGTITQQIIGGGFNRNRNDDVTSNDIFATTSTYHKSVGFIARALIPPGPGVYTINYKAFYSGSGATIPSNKCGMNAVIINTNLV